MYIPHISTLPHTRINLNPHNLNVLCHIFAKQHEGGSSTHFQFLRFT